MPKNIALRSTRRSEEHTSELQSLTNLVCRLLLEKKKHSQATGIATDSKAKRASEGANTKKPIELINEICRVQQGSGGGLHRHGSVHEGLRTMSALSAASRYLSLCVYTSTCSALSSLSLFSLTLSLLHPPASDSHPPLSPLDLPLVTLVLLVFFF